MNNRIVTLLSGHLRSGNVLVLLVYLLNERCECARLRHLRKTFRLIGRHVRGITSRLVRLLLPRRRLSRMDCARRGRSNGRRASCRLPRRSLRSKRRQRLRPRLRQLVLSEVRERLRRRFIVGRNEELCSSYLPRAVLSHLRLELSGAVTRFSASRAVGVRLIGANGLMDSMDVRTVGEVVKVHLARVRDVSLLRRIARSQLTVRRSAGSYVHVRQETGHDAKALRI